MSAIRITRFVGALLVAQVLGGCAMAEQAVLRPSSDYQRLGKGCLYAFGLLGALGPIALPLMFIGAVGVCLPAVAVVGFAHAVVSQAGADPGGTVRDR